MEAVRTEFYRIDVGGLEGGRLVPNVTLLASITFEPEGIGRYRLLFVMRLENPFEIIHMDIVVTGPEILIRSHCE